MSHSPVMYDLTDRAILVTGSTRGIGKAIATKLAECGATVGVHGRDLEVAKSICVELPGDSAIPLSGDFSDPETAAQVVDSFAQSAGHLDGLVNNAGGGKAVAFRGVTLEKWRSGFALNLEACLCASQKAYNLMRRQKSGSIVNIASIAAHGPGKWMSADYAAAKAGIVSLTKSLAFEAGRLGIRVNAVSPGIIETDMTSVLTENMKQSLGIPLGRTGAPEDVASAVTFLLSEQAGYITGQVLHVNGGLLM